MEYFFMIVVIFLVTLQSVTKKEYNVKSNKDNAFSFSGITSLFAMLFFIAAAKFHLNFTKEVFIYSLLFGISFASFMIGTFYAIKWGSMSITLLITSYSLIIPAIYGIIFLEESLKFTGFIGFLLLIISLLLIYEKKDSFIFSFKWLFSMIIGFFGNGFCSTIQKIQQTNFSGNYKNEFMIMALLVCFIISFIMAAINKESLKNDLKICFSLGMMNGIANGVVNLLVMILTSSIPNSILFPSISAGGIVLGFFLSVCLYRERLTYLQKIGYFLGTASVVLLNM